MAMTVRPRTAKARGESVNEPYSGKSFDSKPEESSEEMVEDDQNSDKQLDEYEEQSEEDEGSLYAPTKATSESCGERPDEDEHLTGLPPVDLCKFLRLLPRELRDKIYGYVLRLDSPISKAMLKFKCISCPSVTGTLKGHTSQSQIHEARNLLRTCHQIRDEGKQVFYEVNSWGLHRARLREGPPADPSAAMHVDTQKQFDRLQEIEATKHFEHVSMQALLSPLAYCDLTIPDTVALNDPAQVQHFEMTYQPSIVAFHKLDETAQCELFGVAFDGLVHNRARIFPKLKSVKVEVSLHTKRVVPDAPIDPLNRCGITFHVRIKLECKKREIHNAPLPILPAHSVMYAPYLVQRAIYLARNQRLHASIPDDYWASPLADSRRRMFSPFHRLPGVHSVEVERYWTVRYRQEDGRKRFATITRAQPLRRMWRFRTVGDMLRGAGTGFGEFLDPALEYFEAFSAEVIEIIENTTGDVEWLLVA